MLRVQNLAVQQRFWCLNPFVCSFPNMSWLFNVASLFSFPTSSNIFQRLPTSSNIFQHLPTSSNIFQHLPTSSNVFPVFQAPSPYSSSKIRPQIGSLAHHQIRLAALARLQLNTFAHSLHPGGQLTRGEVELLSTERGQIYQIEHPMVSPVDLIYKW